MKMKTPSLVLILCVALASMILTTSCLVPAPPPGAVYVQAAPPRAVVEVRGVVPGSDHVWIQGYHRWDGTRYVWTSGRWERRPHSNAVWVAGRWRHHRNGWYWVDGRWK